MEETVVPHYCHFGIVAFMTEAERDQILQEDDFHLQIDVTLPLQRKQCEDETLSLKWFSFTECVCLS